MTKNYIDNKAFEEIIEGYKKDPKAFEDKLVPMLDLLISNILESFRFRVSLDDAKQDCYYLILKIIKNYHPDKGSAFNFFTTVIVNNLKLHYTKDKTYRTKLANYVERNKDRLLDT